MQLCLTSHPSLRQLAPSLAQPSNSAPVSASSPHLPTDTSTSPTTSAVAEASSDFSFLLSPPPVDSVIHDEYESYSSSDEEEHGDLENRGVAKWLQRLNLQGPGGYQGKSSKVHLIKDALRIRSKSLQLDTAYDAGLGLQSFNINSTRRPEMWAIYPVSIFEFFAECHDFTNALQWETPRLMGNYDLGEYRFSFPEQDLLNHLIDNYFTFINPYIPLFNQFLFRRQVLEGLHLTNHGFAGTVLLVAALGSRASNDPRIYVDPNQTQSGGWKWFNQVQDIRRPLVAPATIYDIQIIIVGLLSHPARGI
jgi:hypothetical protein